jgi:hypothetical protein
MSVERLRRIQNLIQEDPVGRGLRSDPASNLITASEGDFALACQSMATAPNLAVGIITGFLITQARPPSAETDGPPGAIFLSRALTGIGANVVLASDAFCVPALGAGLVACHLDGQVPVITLPSVAAAKAMTPAEYWREFTDRAGELTHLIALERLGPNHTNESISQQEFATSDLMKQFAEEVPEPKQGRYYSMRGSDITERMSPAHWLFEANSRPGAPITTIGIGDGGNEIGMGKLPWELIRRNIPGGGLIACRTATDYLIVSGISNWGAYGLAAGVRMLRGAAGDSELFNPGREGVLFQLMVERGPLVDGTTGQVSLSVDGLSMDRYLEPLRQLHAMV